MLPTKEQLADADVTFSEFRCLCDIEATTGPDGSVSSRTVASLLHKGLIVVAGDQFQVTGAGTAVLELLDPRG